MGFLSKLLQLMKAEAKAEPAISNEPAGPLRQEPVAEPAAAPAAPEDPPELAAAIDALQAERYGEVEPLALPYVNAEAPLLKADANRLCALACSRLERWPQAFGYWLSLFELEPSAHNAQQLATTSVMCGEIERGEAWLMKADEINAETHELSAVTLRTNIITALSKTGQYKAAVKHLEWLKRVYEHLSITDSTFLYMRGVPFFSAFLENSYPILNRVWTTDEMRVWYRSMQPQLDAEGREAVQKWVERLAA